MECSNNYSKASVSLWFFSIDKPSLNNNVNITDFVDNDAAD